MATWIDRTQTSGNRQIFTWSAWVKFTGDNLTSYAHLATTNPNPGNWDTIRLDNNRKFEIICNNNSNILRTSRVFRDTNAWYHFVVAVDTTQSTDTNRTKLYVNGVQETSFESTGYPPQNHNTNFNTNSQTFRIGHNTWSTGGGEYFTGLMSDVNFADGNQYSASTFGSTDATTGQWKINTDPTFTLGTNGFTILKNGNTITDQSTNSNNFTLGSGTLTNTLDCPSNVFATGNSLDTPYTNYTFSNGNNTLTSTTGSGFTFSTATLGMTSGKYYWEAKAVSKSAGIDNWVIGFTSASAVNSTTVPGALVTGYGMYAYSGVIYNAGSTAYGVTYGVGDIIGIALDLDNLKAYWSKNGVWVSSANPSTNSGGYTITAPVGNIGAYVPAWSWYEGDSNTGQTSYNFGNGYFGTTAVSSAGTPGSTPGTFEYDVPTGYEPLSTKGLNA